ncbi:hypothetical protein LCGC14_3023950, partial [marine sediment metagenome]
MVDPVRAVADATTVLKEEDISCTIAGGVFIEPVITNCNHKIEKLALARLLREDKHCPYCRAIVTSAVPDVEFAKKIQDQFVKVDGVINNDNKKIFDDQKRALLDDPQNNSVRGAPIIPDVSRSRGVEMDADESLRYMGIDPSEGLSSLFLDFLGMPSPFSGPGAAGPSPSTLFSQVQSSIRSNNLTQAEQTADTIPRPDFLNYRNRSYEKIAGAHIAKANTHISHLQHATRVTSKISAVAIKDGLFTQITLKYTQHKEYSKAFQTANKMQSFVFRFLNRIAICLGATFHG